MRTNFFLTCVTIAFLFCAFFASFNYFVSRKNPKQSDLNTIADKVSADLAVPVVPAPVETFNILVVPGHNTKDGGGNFKTVYERDLVAAIGTKISDRFNEDPKFKAIVTRSADAWNPIFDKYFEDEKQAIIDWKNERQKESKALMAEGKIKYVPDMAFHSEVTPEVSVKLYGMNKWANDNDIDLIVNLHFNDSIRTPMSVPGGFKGFTIFIPESQMKNHTSSEAAAQYVFDELKKIEPPELDNLLEDQSLISLGASGTLNPPSMLIEYAYIYEKNLLTDADREKTIDQMAQQTVLGIRDYFDALNKDK